MRQRAVMALRSAIVTGLFTCLGVSEPVLARDGAKKQPPVVFVEVARLQNVEEGEVFSGRVEATRTIELHARVSGTLEQRHFKQGSFVKKGDLLYEIESKPYVMVANEQDANLAASKAEEKDARASFSRIATLHTSGNASQRAFDKAQSLLAQAEAKTKLQTARLGQAKLKLGYTKVFAPADGQVGRSTHAVGDLVGPQSAPLATLTVIDPVYLTFPVPLASLTKFKSGNGVSPDFVVQILRQDGSTYSQKGQLAFISNTADPNTGSVLVRAQISNPEFELIDQELVDVRVYRKNPEKKLLVAQTAIHLDQQGSYVLKVDAKNQLTLSRVTVGRQHGRAIEVLSGLRSGDRVVVRSHVAAQPGMTVTAKLTQAHHNN